MVTYNDIQACPIATAFNHIGKKWTINILRDMFMGKKQFKEFFHNSPGISAKMLSQRLTELQDSGLIEKKVVTRTPVQIEYALTKKGRGLDKVLHELVIFSMKNYPNEVFKPTAKNLSTAAFERLAKDGLHA